jgi:hypothetical protein
MSRMPACSPPDSIHSRYSPSSSSAAAAVKVWTVPSCSVTVPVKPVGVCSPLEPESRPAGQVERAGFDRAIEPPGDGCVGAELCRIAGADVGEQAPFVRGEPDEGVGARHLPDEAGVIPVRRIGRGLTEGLIDLVDGRLRLIGAARGKNRMISEAIASETVVQVRVEMCSPIRRACAGSLWIDIRETY